MSLRCPRTSTSGSSSLSQPVSTTKPRSPNSCAGTAAFLRGYADTAPSLAHALLDKNATVRPLRLRERFDVIRTDENRLFRLFIDVALYREHQAANGGVVRPPHAHTACTTLVGTCTTPSGSVWTGDHRADRQRTRARLQGTFASSRRELDLFPTGSISAAYHHDGTARRAAAEMSGQPRTGTSGKGRAY